MRPLNDVPKGLRATGLVVLGLAVAFVGRELLNALMDAVPGWAPTIEKFGGFVLGLSVVLVALLPLFRLYGVFDRSEDDDVT
ncbi:MAG TPA: hypothetical protein VFY73_07270 [Ideonella sp.]|uniref:hypothetical protein n=1 Tax=Ideonella sp. TaxID=1929293 RepID=UPI002E37AEBA|nr:hypothetical protein [Ideonella sp.]HEX5683820.1 hypothetical protein [Ideonella sp.]